MIGKESYEYVTALVDNDGSNCNVTSKLSIRVLCLALHLPLRTVPQLG